MNKVILLGRLTDDPVVKVTTNDPEKKWARYTLAVSKISKKEEADFIQCVVFGKNAEFAEKYLKKGIKIAVCGRLQVRSWDDNGTKKWVYEVIVEEHDFAEGKK